VKTLSPEGRAVLSRATIEPRAVILNDPDLDRALYREVDQFLLALGGKWSRQARAHQFPAGTGAVEDAIREGQALDRVRTYEQFYTPVSLAEWMMIRVGEVVQFKRGVHVLEPSAGCGALIREPLRCGVMVSAIEIDPDSAISLSSLVGPGSAVWCQDFLEWEPVDRPPVDVVLMNPPFSRGQDVAHVRRAFGFLRPGGVLVAITSPHWTFAQDRTSEEFRQWFEALGGEVWDLPSGSFKQSGTGVETRMIRIVKPGART